MVTARFFNLLNHAGNQFFLALTLALNLRISICFSSTVPNQAFWGKVPCQFGIQSTAHVAWPKTTLGPNAKIVSVVGHAYGLGIILATVVSCLDQRAPLLEHSGREFAPYHFDLGSNRLFQCLLLSFYRHYSPFLFPCYGPLESVLAHYGAGVSGRGCFDHLGFSFLSDRSSHVFLLEFW